MSKDVILKIENLSKQYRLGTVSTGTISHDLNRFWAKICGKEDPYLKIGETNNRASKGTSEYVWALKDINFEVKRGEVLGIIGKNGAGKSTLLKILSKVTGPTTGAIKSKGRIASLLEVGTGFHPEMTGKENIFLNGAILGMTKKEIANKLDEIVEFSGCERYIDTPVKRYSSGMKVRLAFAVAAHLEPDILIVDEVLAVGDAEFQKKAIGKMQDISGKGGRTVLFVSHNMAAVKSLCNRGVILENGEVKMIDTIDQIISSYLTKYNNEKKEVHYKLGAYKGSDLAQFTYAKVSSLNNSDEYSFIEGDAIEFEFEFYIKKVGTHNLGITFHLRDELGNLVFVGTSCYDNRKVSRGSYREKVIIPPKLMIEGIFTISDLFLVENIGTVSSKASDVLRFQIAPKDNGFGIKGKKEGIVKPDLKWQRIL
jgi:lipopolysaccharide transport system ATP-binding protein